MRGLTGLAQVKFIGHFVSVYERSATRFARESARWSRDPENIERYHANGNKMPDVMVEYDQALGQLPIEERRDNSWPYEY